MRRIISSRRKQGQFTSAPVVSGNTIIGSVLSVTNGVFDGPSSTYTYQWFLDGSPISGATASTYTLPALSNGILRCVVKATNSRGSVKSTSNFFTIRNSFNFVVKTDNTSTGSSTATQFKLPLVSTGTYNCTVYWGDGTSSVITTWNQAQTTKTYATAGTYNVSITGTITGFCFNNAGDKLKILSVGWWGPLRPANNYGTFFGCSNLTLENVRDVIDLTGMTSLATFFYACTSLVKVNRIGEWDLTNITSLNRMFENSSNFNDNVGGWNTSNVVDMENVFANARNFNNGGSDAIKNWNTSKVTTFRFLFGSDTSGIYHSFNQPIGNWNTSSVTSMISMFSRNNKFDQPIGNWNTSAVTTMSNMFGNTLKFNQNIGTWNTSNVTDMSFMFNCTLGDGIFNNGGRDSIKNWNTSKVTTIAQMFTGSPYFNQDVSTKSVTVGGNTYTAWDTLNVINMGFVFYSYPLPRRSGDFNQNIGNWNTSKVTTTASMFVNQPNFNQDLSTKTVTVGASTYTAWDMLNVTTLSSMFGISPGKSGVFNQNIGNWNTSKVTSINSLFVNQPAFNHDISTKTVTVGASTYTAWDMLNVTTMRYTFFNNIINPTSQFNQNIGNWNTVKVTDMTAMLFNTVKFNQNISSWKVNLVTAFNNTTVAAETFADYIGLSQTNYDALLIGWASRPVLANKAINFGTTKYSSAAVAARATLTSAPNNWTIIDGGQI
jgi:surface protein